MPSIMLRSEPTLMPLRNGSVKIIDPGHEYELASLDGEQVNRLVFVKREGKGYPGNVGHHPGTTMQECLRALIDRAKYVQNQIPCEETHKAIKHMADAVYLLELRAARRHNRIAWFTVEQALSGPTCVKCGHVGCAGTFAQCLTSQAP